MNHTKFYKRISAIIIVLCAAFGIISAAAGAVGTNSAPVATEQEYTTYKDVPITGSAAAIDAEGDMVTFAVSRDPKKGTVKMESDGTFVYTPISGKKGRDAFNYVAIDSNGNISADATVTIHILKLTADVSYSDMAGNDANYAALCLAENGVFVGSRVGDEYYFSPEETVTRGEFLVMCLNVCKIDKLSDITKTGFADDEEMAMWLKPYVAAGLMNGIIKGYSDNGGVVFSSDKEITLAEAMVTLDNAIALSDVYAGPVNDVCPTWAQQSCANLQSCNIISERSVYDVPLTRAEAAKMLAGAIDVINAR